MTDSDPVAKLTRFSPEYIDKLIRWLSRQSRSVQLEAVSAADLAQLVRQARAIKEQTETGQAKRYERDLASLSQTEQLRIEQIKQRRPKPSPIRQRIYKRRALIQRLRAQGLGWPSIAEYLRRHTKLDVSGSYLRRACIKLGIEGGE